MKRAILTIWVLGLLFVCWSTDRAYTQTTERLQPSDLEYKGAFRLPAGTSTTKSWLWGGFAMTYYPGGDPGGANDGYPGSIYGTGHAWEFQVSEISIPAPVISSSKNLSQLNTATTLQAFRDLLNVGSLEMPRAGLAYLSKQGSQSSDKIYYCIGHHLMDEYDTFPSHGWFELNLSSPRTQGNWYINIPYYHYKTNDYMFGIPTGWAAAGTPGLLLATGRFRDGGWSGQGPSLYAIGPWNDGNPPASGSTLTYKTLLQYTSTNDPDSWNEATNHTMTDYHHSDEWSGAAWVTAGSKGAVVFVGTKGTGDCWYGDENGPCLDCEGERGWWSTGFVGQFLFYDPADLAKVAAGTMEPHEPQPYATLNIDQYLYHIASGQLWYHLGGACFDRANGYFYVFEPYADQDESSAPIVHVWKVKTSGTAASITVSSPDGGESWNGNSTHAITWTSTGTVGNVKIEYSTDNGGSWSTVTSSTSNDGSHSWTVPNLTSSRCLVRAGETDGSPTDTSNAVFSITAAGGGGDGSIALNRGRLNFGAAVSGSAPGSQAFSVSNGGSGSMSWSVTDDASWLSCSPCSGTNAGTVTVSVNSSGLGAGSYTASLTVGSGNASNSPQTLPVYLTVYGSGSDTAPFGSFDSPSEGAAVRSSVPVTGWVLDDIGVSRVEIWRDPVSGEGGGLIYIGDALQVDGARPDVITNYPGYPMNYMAGWGYMLLTNFLPNGGNGSYRLHVYVSDGTGHRELLGSRNITCDNAAAVKPFGAIDTPAPGATVSGTLRNWGWVLTPLPNSIPTDGSTITVYVDGINRGNPVYNLYRSDIAALFPGYANSDGAFGYFDIDTAALENKVMDISWVAVDSAGNADGIGSRYITVANAGSRVGARRKAEPALPSVIPPDKVSPVGVVLGYNDGAEPRRVLPAKDGTVYIDIEPLQRVVLHAPEGKPWLKGMSLVGDRCGALPIGSTLDRDRGMFYWRPGPGFAGDFHFLFISKDKDTDSFKRQKIRIKIQGSKQRTTERIPIR